MISETVPNGMSRMYLAPTSARKIDKTATGYLASSTIDEVSVGMRSSPVPGAVVEGRSVRGFAMVDQDGRKSTINAPPPPSCSRAWQKAITSSFCISQFFTLPFSTGCLPIDPCPLPWTMRTQRW